MTYCMSYTYLYDGSNSVTLWGRRFCLCCVSSWFLLSWMWVILHFRSHLLQLRLLLYVDWAVSRKFGTCIRKLQATSLLVFLNFEYIWPKFFPVILSCVCFMLFVVFCRPFTCCVFLFPLLMRCIHLFLDYLCCPEWYISIYIHINIYTCIHIYTGQPL